jgi:hypothetical protein
MPVVDQVSNAVSSPSLIKRNRLLLKSRNSFPRQKDFKPFIYTRNDIIIVLLGASAFATVHSYYDAHLFLPGPGNDRYNLDPGRSKRSVL